MDLKTAIKSEHFWIENFECELMIMAKNPNFKFKKITLKKYIKLALKSNLIPIINFVTPESYLEKRKEIEEFFENLEKTK